MHFKQHISSEHFDCLDCGGCFESFFTITRNPEHNKNRIYWEAYDDTGYSIGIYCDECYHDVAKELNGRNRREVVSG